ncbi:MAG: GAF domain-containing protein [Spirochaetes bacterium]|jgi:two-component sensor histidine kinase|nr:GAF domain-containing protein [Spirochaetota bacterium]
MRSIRNIFAVFEGVTLFVAILFVVVLFTLIGREIKSSFYKSQALEVDKVEMTIQNFIEGNRDLFAVYSRMSDKNEPAALLVSYTDIYFCDAGFVVTRILKNGPGSPVFPGYNLGKSMLPGMLAAIDASTPVVSAMFRAPEDERLSIYVGARSGRGYLVGRIGIAPLKSELQRIAEYSGSIVIIATGDGYILSSSGDPLHLHILPSDDSSEINVGGVDYLYMRKHSEALGKDIAILTPTSTVYALLESVERYSRLFIILFALIILAKIVGQTVLVMRPFGRFSALIRRWEPDAPAPEIPPEYLQYAEIASLYKNFNEKSEQIHEAVKALRESEGLLKIQRDLGMVLESSADIPSVLALMLEAALRIEGIDSAGIYLVDEETGTVELASSAGLSSEFLNKVGRYEADSPGMRVVMEGLPLYIDEHALKERGVGVGPEHLEREGLRMLAVVPIRHLGRSIACINVASKSVPLIPQTSRNALESMASTLGNVIVRIRNQDQVAASLREKEILLKEIHHRVKNNFQVIISLLNLHSKNIKNEELLRHFNDSRNRIRAMALIHEKLYQSGDFAHIDFAAYMETLTSELCGLYATPGNPVACRLDVERVNIPMDLAIPCSLIVNEILSNSLKYAFPPSWEGTAEIILKIRETENGSVELEISDNGVGLPEDREPGAPDSGTLGLSLIGLLVRQIKATLELDRANGTRYTIVFRGGE